MNMFIKGAVTALVTAALSLTASPAFAGGSDSPTPYTVDSAGVTLPSGRTFGVADVQDANFRLVSGTTKNLHYPGATAPADGSPSLVWSDLGFAPGDCIEWVQLHGFNEHFGEGGQKPVCIPTEEPPVEEPTVVEEVALYCYVKLDLSKPAAWENSGEQTLATVKTGNEWFTDEEARALCNIPAEACTPVDGHAYQQDKVRHDGEFVFPEHITYPVDNIGWPPIYDAKHGDLTQTQKLCTSSTSEPEPPTLALTGYNEQQMTTGLIAAVLLLMAGSGFLYLRHRRQPRHRA